MADIFQEVDEEVRRDRALEFWRRWGNWITGGAVAIVVAIAAQNGWQRYEQSRREAAGLRFEMAVADLRSDKTKAIAALDQLAGEGAAPYNSLARMREGQAEAEAGRNEAAAAKYGMAAGGLTQPEMRDLAQLLSLIQRFDQTPPDELKAALTALAAPDRPLRPLARELLAALALRSGDLAAAREIYESLNGDMATPRAMKSRVEDMLASLAGEKK